MKNKNYTINVAFGVTFINLAIVGLCSLFPAPTFFFAVRAGVVLCNLAMGGVLLFNNKSTSDAAPLHRPYWLGVIAANIAAVKVIDETCPLMSVHTVVFVVGLAMALASLWSLGKSFAVTPMTSTIKTRRMFSFVRHPMYLGESLMVLSCLLTSMSVVSALVLLLYAFFMVMRIGEEEKLLLKTEEYQKYCVSTPWRLIPFVW
ncbi:MAG: isoprenylcysteine carboxylmethyltransferase family protein [Muribaculaceae bacterium]|nr:isoprenylcysteine carboxylmethyltransferase family protein [Muribaculaceae bacterium]